MFQEPFVRTSVLLFERRFPFIYTIDLTAHIHVHGRDLRRILQFLTIDCIELTNQSFRPHSSSTAIVHRQRLTERVKE